MEIFKKQKGTENFLGVYIGPKEICFSQVKVTDSLKIEVEHLVRVPTGFEVKEKILRPLALNSVFFNEKAAWVTPLKQAVKKIGWNTNKAIITLSSQFSILRYFVMPHIDRRFWSKSIPLESKKYIPVSFEEVIYDFIVYPVSPALAGQKGGESGRKLGVLFGLTQRKTVEFLINLFKEMNLEISAIEINACSFERIIGFLNAKNHAGKGYIHFYGNANYMLFSSEGYPVLFRETEQDSSSTMSERRRLDIKGSVQFIDRYVGGRSYNQIIISGDNLEVWQQLAAQESQMEVSTWDPAKLLNLKTHEPYQFFSIGAAARGRIRDNLILDISGATRSKILEKQVQSYVWGFAFLVSGFLLFLTLLAQTKLIMLNSRISKISRAVPNISEFQGQSPDALKSKIEKMQSNVQTIYKLLSDVEFLAPKLQAIADAIPSDFWLIGMSYANPFSASDFGAAKELRLTGETYLQGDVKLAEIGNFTKAVKTSREFRTFAEKGSIEYDLMGKGVLDELDQEAQKSSGFTITCSLKKK